MINKQRRYQFLSNLNINISKTVLFLTAILILVGLTGCKTTDLNQLRKSEYRYTSDEEFNFEKIVEIFQKGGQNAKEAATAFGRLGDPRALTYLASALEQGSIASKEIITAMKMIGDRRAVPVLIQLIKNNSSHSEQAIVVLGDIGDSRAVPILEQVTKEHRPYYLKAIDALGKLKSGRSVSLLMDEMKAIPDDEAQNIRLRIINQTETEQGAKKHIRTFDLPQNLPPKIDIISKEIKPEGHVIVRYQLIDAEFDTLAITPEFSVNGGLVWHPASVEGRLKDLQELRYSGTLIWRSDLDNIPLNTRTNLLFKLTSNDYYIPDRDGIPSIISLNVDSAQVNFHPYGNEITKDVQFGLQYRNLDRAYADSLQFHYSIDNETWMPATVIDGLPPIETSDDSLWVVWQTELDLPHFDQENVRLRVSTNKNNTLGTLDILDKLHIDNNRIPQIEILDFDEFDLFKINYRIMDEENDPVSLSIFYSMDDGNSWKQGTISGNIEDIQSDSYNGSIRWYSEFDVTELRNSPLKIRLRPFDNDPGVFIDSRNFYLNDTDYTKLTKGRQSGFVEIKYPTITSDTTRPVGQYSLDRGLTWQDASLEDLEYQEGINKTNVKVNWDIGEDISSQFKQIETIGNSLDMIGDMSIVPDLLLMASQRSSQSRIVRRRSVQAERLLSNNTDWVVDGMIQTLIHHDRNLQRLALTRLEIIDEPKVASAIIDYHAYWNSFGRLNIENQNRLREEDQQSYQELLNTSTLPTSEDMVEIMLRKGMSRSRAEIFIKDLEIVKLQTQVQQDYYKGKISLKEYLHKVEELGEEQKRLRENKR